MQTQAQDIDRTKCKANPHFDLWLKMEGRAPFSCIIDVQMDWSVEEYEWCCEEEGVGCLKQSDLAAKFEERQQEEDAQDYVRKAWLALFGGLSVGAAALAVCLVAARSHQLPYQFLHRAGTTSDPECGRTLRARSRRPGVASDRRLLIAPQDDEGAGLCRDFSETLTGEKESPHRGHASEEPAHSYAYIFADGKRVTLM